MKHKKFDPRAAAGMTGAVDPDVVIEDDINHEQPPRPGENPARRHKAAVEIIDRAIRDSIDYSG